jgi:transglutaminase-like putative cysteine protease
MERLRIEHITEYRFSAPVTLNEHRLMLRPREGHDVRIESSRLEISPSYRISWHRDAFDNSIATVHFHQATSRLWILSRVVIQHYQEYPSIVLEGPDSSLPISPYEEREMMDLAPYKQTSFPCDHAPLQAWLVDLGLSGYPLYLSQLQTVLNQAIYREFQYEIRQEQGVQSPALTLSRMRGSCRDYATLFIEACRMLGLASRFVSGYLHAPATEAGFASTHAWAEVFFKGYGWQGFDPTLGEMTHNRHIAVAVARDPEAVPPISGSFIGSGYQRPAMFVGVQVNLLI